MRVLVVEDDALVRELVVEALRDEGFDVIHAADGRAGTGLVRATRCRRTCREHNPDMPVIYAIAYSPLAYCPVPVGRVLQKTFRPEQIELRDVTATESAKERREP